jgi:hypothetical protein
LPIPSADQLNGVRGPIHLKDALAFANAATSQVFVVDSAGQLSVRFSRYGRGPGEATMIGTLMACRDAVGIQSRDALHWWTFTGNYLRTTRAEASEAGWIVEPKAVLDDCSAVIEVERRTEPTGTEAFRVAHVLQKDGVRTLLATIEQLSRFGVDFAGRRTTLPLPWAVDVQVSSAAGQVILGSGVRPEFQVFSADGRLQRVVRWTARQVPLTAAHRTLFMAYRDSAMYASPDEAPLLQLFDQLAFSGKWPAFAQILAATDGSVWVREFANRDLLRALPVDPPDEGTDWLVFGPDGELRGSAQVPGNFTVRSISSHTLLGTVLDSTGVERIARADVRWQRAP